MAKLMAAICVGLSLFVGSCGGPPEPRYANGKTLIENTVDARIAVRARLKDPASAQWGAITVADRTGETVVCGTVNARNGFGGYMGEQSFMVTGSEAVFPRDVSKGGFAKLWAERCG